MARRLLFLLTGCGAVVMMTTGPHVAAPVAQAAATGTITGRLRLMSAAPASPIIRMGADPLCSRANAGKRLTQEIVLRSADGGLANAFVDLQGAFPATPVPTAPVTIDQRGCVFVPRVVGARVGQMLQVTNSDPTGHNVHSLSTRGNQFNVSQPLTGMKSTFPLKNVDVVMRIKCDIHSWMVSYVGVVAHPYFGVSGADGTFVITRVPAGRHAIRVWHERYGRLTQTVDIKAGGTATIDFAYTGTEQPSTAGILHLVIPGNPTTVTLAAGRS